MRYFTIAPPPVLKPFVRFFWVFEGQGITGAAHPYVYRSMADGCAEILFHYKGVFDELRADGRLESTDRSCLAGQAQAYTRFTIREDFSIFGAYIYPFALPVFFGVPAHVFSNQLPDLKVILGREDSALEERIMLARSNLERAALLSVFLEDRLRRRSSQAEDPFYQAVRQVVEAKGQVNIPLMAENYCLSMRHFQRKFKQASGFSPKRYARILRFQAAMDHYDGGYRSLTEIAYQCGYYDQSHFIHEFREFSGYHPSQFFHGRTEGVEWRES